MDTQKIYEQIDMVDTGRYALRKSEALAIHEKNQGACFEVMVDAFRYGFLKGQWAAKAEMKKKGKTA